MLEKLRLLLDIQNAQQDDTLLALLDVAKEEFEDFCHRDYEDRFESLVVSMAVFKYNSLGNEGLKGESYSDITMNYMEDYPVNIVRQLKNCRKLITF